MKKHHQALFIATIPIQVIFYAMLWKYSQYVECAIIALSWLAFACVFGLVGYMACMGYWRIRDRMADVDLKRADVVYRMAEAKRLEQTVTPIKAGDNVVVTNLNYPMQLAVHVAPPLPLADKVATINQIAAPMSEANIMDGVRTGETWIKDTVFNRDGTLKAYHAKMDGPTGAGKTHLMLYLMWLLQQPYPKAEYWLLDPKFEGESSGWPFTPFVDDFENMAIGAEYLYQNVVVKRKHDKRMGIMPQHPAFFIFDEADGSFDEHGEKFTKPVRRIIKEARSVMGSALVLGQSPLIKENGFSSAIFRNTARFVLGIEAVAYTRNPQFGHFDKAFRAKLHEQLLYLQETRQRSALVIPSNDGLPFVGVIPDLPKPNFNQVDNGAIKSASKTILALPSLLPTMDLSSIEPVDGRIGAMAEAYRRGDNLTSVASIGYKGQGDGQNIRCLQLLRKHGVALRPEHAAKISEV